MIKEARQLDSATVEWAKDIVVEVGFRRECIQVISADADEPYDHVRFAAFGTEYVLEDGAVVSAVKCELLNQ